MKRCQAALSRNPVAAMEKTALDSTTTNLIEQVVQFSNMQKAWKAVRANHGAPGPDGITINDFPNHFYQHWPGLLKSWYYDRFMRAQV